MTAEEQVANAAQAAEANFEREYGSGEVGLVLPAAIAVDEHGQVLARIAVLPGHRGAHPSDQVHAEAVEQALCLDTAVAAEAVACSAVRIDIGTPRVLAWHRHERVALLAWPRFEELELVDWESRPVEVLPSHSPQGSPGELVELESTGPVKGAIGVLVKERLQAEREAVLEDLREAATNELQRRVNSLSGVEPFPDFWILRRDGKTSTEPLPILGPVPLQRVFATFTTLLRLAEADACAAVFTHQSPDSNEQVNLVAADFASEAASLGMAELRREHGKAVLYEANLDQLPDQSEQLSEAENWPRLDLDNQNLTARGQARAEDDPRLELLDRRVRSTLGQAAERLTHPELDFPAFATCADGHGDTFAFPGLLVSGGSAPALAMRALEEARAAMVAIPDDHWEGDHQNVQLRYLDGDGAHMFATAFIERKPNQPGRITGRTRFAPYPGSASQR